jgi:predicted kinase
MDTGIYSTEFSRQVYDKLFSDAKSLLRQGDSVVLDASFIKSQERQTAQNIAAETDSDFFILECVLDEENTHKRLMDRFKGNSVSDGRWEIYGPQKKKFDPVSGIPTDRHLIIDTALPLPDQITQFISNI